jgi:hypothetical protein
MIISFPGFSCENSSKNSIVDSKMDFSLKSTKLLPFIE